jgi:hypothetical protein
METIAPKKPLTGWRKTINKEVNGRKSRAPKRYNKNMTDSLASYIIRRGF